MSEPGPNEPAPIQTTVVGQGTGDGGGLMRTEITHTPWGQPNIVTTFISPILALTVRFIKTFLTSMVGLITAGGPTGAIPASDFAHLVTKVAGLSLSVAVIDLLRNIVTLSTNWENKFPLLGA